MFQLSTRPLFADHYLTVGLVAVVLLALLWLGPGRSRTTPARRRWLMLLRLAAIVVVILIMVRPTVVYTETKQQSATLVILADRSRSMKVADAFGGKTRWQALGELLEDAVPDLDELAERLQIKVYAFDEEAHELDFTARTLDLEGEPEGKQTALGSVLDDVLRREAGQRLAGVIVLTDGAQRAYAPRDLPPQTPARQLNDLGYPLYAVVFGQSAGLGQVRDVALKDLLVDQAVFVKNELPVTGAAQAQGYVNQSVPVQLLWETAPGKMEIVDTIQLQASRDGEQLPLALNYVPELPGEYRLTLLAVPQPGETVTTNNELSTYVTVLKGGLNVLYLEGRTLPEQKFVRRSLAEARDIQVDFLRINPRHPETRPADLLARFQPGKYDVYILGDLDSSAFQDDELETLRQTVDRGAGLIMLGGINSFGPGGYAGTPLADVLPVEMDKLERQPLDEAVRGDVHLPGQVAIRPTPQGLKHFVMLIDSRDQNAATWTALPPLDGANRLVKKRSATVLATAPGGEPLLLADNSGNGRVMAFAGDSTWHWWLAGKADAHRRFWRQLVLWLARKDQATDDTVWVKLDQRRFAPAARVDFTAGARSPQGEPLEDAQLTAEVILPDGTRRPVRLSRESDSSAGTFGDTAQAGEYTIEITATHEGASLGSARARFLVFDQDLELDNPAADPTAMASLAAMTGGQSLPPEQFGELLERLKAYPDQLEIQVQTRRELYDNPFLFVLLIGMMGTEWFLRKKWGLV
jgi:uncharacterized membrane protein